MRANHVQQGEAQGYTDHCILQLLVAKLTFGSPTQLIRELDHAGLSCDVKDQSIHHSEVSLYSGIGVRYAWQSLWDNEALDTMCGI